MNKITVSSCLALLLPLFAGAVALPPLFSNGKTEWKIEVPTDAAPPVTFAVTEFTNALMRISGTAFEVVAPNEGGTHAIRFETGAADKFDKEIAEYKTDKGHLLISGNQPQATLRATYAFLQNELGVRWLWRKAYFTRNATSGNFQPVSPSAIPRPSNTAASTIAATGVTVRPSISGKRETSRISTVTAS